MTDHEDLLGVARRVVWFDPPEETLRNPKLFLAHVMTYGNLEEILIARRRFRREDFAAVLDDPPPGVFDPRSWTYWNLMFDRSPAPPLPVRTFPVTTDPTGPPARS